MTEWTWMIPRTYGTPLMVTLSPSPEWHVLGYKFTEEPNAESQSLILYTFSGQLIPYLLKMPLDRSRTVP